ncbi:MAG: glycosyltransferase [Rhodobacteraceae bacterium]|nr:glycosyltransferase [Paracoccaceae bacterium]MCF8515654.1 glycosyltransferase [Paracoccaceae bacterium]MCF8519899.1 glycosyltransferase [Paracoccaceae bacterium]
MGPSAKALRSPKLQALSQDHLAKDLRQALPAAKLRPAAERPSPADTLGVALLRDGLIAPDEMVRALALHARRSGRLTDILVSRDLIGPDELCVALARHWKTEVIHPMAAKPDIRLIDRIGGNFCLRNSLLPWRQTGAVTVIATAQPEEFERHRAKLTEVFGPVAMAIAPAQEIEQTILAYRGKSLARAAETRVCAAESCRNLAGRRLFVPLFLLGLILSVLAVLSPMTLVWGVVGWAVVTLALSTALKIAAGFASTLRRAPSGPAPVLARLPVVSIMVALYRESDIAPRLIRRLGRLEYPRELLDIVLVVEAEDHMTRAALAATDLPPWMRIVVVPDGQVKTKPRALNFALDHCRGSIVGVYDAEDAPEPDQITRVVHRFAERGPDVACLQGVLDFYNPTTNWLSRCFCIEYATWFRLILPGLQRLGLPIPLGGTTLFFRRAVLEELGGWDAHNVTEDADLGMRLYRHGYRTELIETVTGEEANCRALPWVKQRSRWLKGYMMTWATHMRDPVVLWRQLGAWQFAGFQVLFLCTLSQFLLLPVLWSFWITAFGFHHPIASALPHWAAFGLIALFVLTEGVNITLGLIGLRLSGHRFSRLWVPLMHFYFSLGALASYKAAWEMVYRPFYWDKTDHGHFDPP